MGEVRVALEQWGKIMYNGLMSFIVSIVIAMLFFFGGCLQLGAYIARNSVGDIPAYVNGLMLCSWPLAVAAVLFMLIELRLHGGRAGETRYEASGVVERPVPQHTVRPAGDAAGPRVVGNTGARANVPQAAPSASAPQPVPQQVTPPFVTPPPFDPRKVAPPPGTQVAAKPPSMPQENEGEELSFFKL